MRFPWEIARLWAVRSGAGHGRRASYRLQHYPDINAETFPLSHNHQKVASHIRSRPICLIMPDNPVSNPQLDVMTMNAPVEDKIIMYSATLYDYTKKYATSPIVRVWAPTAFSDRVGPNRLLLQTRKQAEREAAAKGSRPPVMSAGESSKQTSTTSQT